VCVAVLEYAMEVLLVVTVLLVLVQIFSRYVIQQNVKGIEEVARLTLVWGCFIGAGYCVIHDKHINIDFIVTRFPPPLRKAVEVISILILLVVSGVMIGAGTAFVIKRWAFPDYSTSLLFPRSLYWLPVPVCGLIVFVNAASRAVSFVGRGGSGR